MDLKRWTKFMPKYYGVKTKKNASCREDAEEESYLVIENLVNEKSKTISFIDLKLGKRNRLGIEADAERKLNK